MTIFEILAFMHIITSILYGVLSAEFYIDTCKYGNESYSFTKLLFIIIFNVLLMPLSMLGVILGHKNK